MVEPGPHLAWSTRSVASDHGKSTAAAEADVAGTVIYGVAGVGSVALNVRYINEGFEQGADSAGNLNGTFVRIVSIVGATFAAPFGDRFDFGFTAKIIREGLDCSGSCNGATAPPLRSALDLGARYFGELGARPTFITLRYVF